MSGGEHVEMKCILTHHYSVHRVLEVVSNNTMTTCISSVGIGCGIMRWSVDCYLMHNVHNHYPENGMTEQYENLNKELSVHVSV